MVSDFLKDHYLYSLYSSGTTIILLSKVSSKMFLSRNFRNSLAFVIIAYIIFACHIFIFSTKVLNICQCTTPVFYDSVTVLGVGTGSV